MPNGTEMSLFPSSSEIANSSSLSDVLPALLQGLMKSWGWQDVRLGVYAAEREQEEIEREVVSTFRAYQEEKDEANQARLITALEAARAATEAEVAYALRQQAYYEAQVKQDAAEKMAVSYLGQWRNWAFQGVKSFFGSTTEQLVEKYAAIASKRQALSAQIFEALEALQTPTKEEFTSSSAVPEPVDSSEPVVARPGHRQLLSNLSSAPSVFPESIQLSDLRGSLGFRLYDCSGSGIAVSSAGDINHDTITDLMVAAPYSTGIIYIVFGSSNLGSVGDLDLRTLNGTNGFQLRGSSGEKSGLSLAPLGDVNGDSIDDLIIGAPLSSPAGRSQAGAAYVIFGGNGIGASGAINLAVLNGFSGFQLMGVASSDKTGLSVNSAGDINNDGINDIILGAPGVSLGGKIQAGAAYVVFGKNGLGSAGTLDLATLNGVNGFILSGVTANDYTGNFVSSAGDVNGDGISDVIIGALQASPSGKNMAGTSYVIFGKNRIGSSGIFDLSTLNGANGFLINGEMAGDQSGICVGSGDINDDNYSDLFVGAPYAQGTGRAYVLFGGVGVGSSGLVDLAAPGINGFRIPGLMAGNLLGTPIGNAGDINGDDVSDLVAGVPYGYPNGIAEAGITYIVFGNPRGGISGWFYLPTLDGSNGFQLNGTAQADRSGWSVSNAGDVNNDGVTDLLIGVPTAGGAGCSGFNYVVFGDKTPQLLINQLTIQQAGRVTLSRQNLYATDNGPVNFNIGAVQHGYFVLISSQEQPPFTFSQSQVDNGQLQFVHDGSKFAPSYSVQVINSGIALSLPPQDATITFSLSPKSQWLTFLTDVKALASITGALGSTLLAGITYLYGRYYFKRKREIENPFANAIHERLRLAYLNFSEGEGKEYATAINHMITLLRTESRVDLEALQASRRQGDQASYRYYADLFAAVIPRYVRRYGVYCNTSYELRLTDLHQKCEVIVGAVIACRAQASTADIAAAGSTSWCSFFSPCCASRPQIQGLDALELPEFKEASSPFEELRTQVELSP